MADLRTGKLNLNQAIRMLTVLEAQRWVGVSEQGGDNKGQIVEMMQKTVDGKAQREPWCMAAVQTWLHWALKYFSVAHAPVASAMQLVLFRSEHCMTVWRNTPITQRRTKPETGFVAIWNYEGTDNGHTAVVVGIDEKEGFFHTIEGNTSDGSGVVREGDGIYEKVRSVNGDGKMKLVGFLDPFANVGE